MSGQGPVQGVFRARRAMASGVLLPALLAVLPGLVYAPDAPAASWLATEHATEDAAVAPAAGPQFPPTVVASPLADGGVAVTTPTLQPSPGARQNRGAPGAPLLQPVQVPSSPPVVTPTATGVERVPSGASASAPAPVSARSGLTLLAMLGVAGLMLFIAGTIGGLTWRRGVAGQVERSRARARQAFAAHADAVVVTTLSGSVLYINPAAERLLGATDAEVQRAPVGALLPLYRRTADSVRSPADMTMAAGTSASSDAVADVALAMSAESAGAVPGAPGVDSADTVQAAQATQAAQAAQAEPAAQAAPATHADRIDPLEAALSTGWPAAMSDAWFDNLPILRCTGRDAVATALPVYLHVTPLRSADKQVTSLALSIGDGLALQAKLLSDRHASHVAGATVDAIIGVSAEETIQSWNARAREMFALEEEDVLGQPVSMLVGAERQAVLSQTVRMALAGERVTDRDLTVQSRRGAECDVSLAAFAVGDPFAGASLNGNALATASALAMTTRSGAMHGNPLAVRVVLVLRDIGERRVSEQRVRHLGAQLVRRAQELQAIFDIAPVGMAIADSPDCQHVRPNVALTSMLGIERAAALSFDGAAHRGYAIWCDGELLREEDSPLRRAVAQREAIVPMELTLQTLPDSATAGESGTEIVVMAYAAPVIDQDLHVVGAIAVFVDISAMKLVDAERQGLLHDAIDARRAAEEASRLKEEFLATVSHELRTPLNAMHGWLEIMQRKPDPQTQARGLDVIRRNVRAQTRVIEDILDVSAFVTGKTRLVIRPVDLLEIVRATIESLRPTADTKSIALQFENELADVTEDVTHAGVTAPDASFDRTAGAVPHLAAGPTSDVHADSASDLVSESAPESGPESGPGSGPEADSAADRAAGLPVIVGAAPVNGDPERIQQIVWNLLSNALKFTPAGGSVFVGVVSTRQTPDDRPAALDQHADERHYELRVRDTGEGIAPVFLPYVFDRFRQADSSIERRHAGLGLGLAIVRHLAEMHGGYAAVESPGLGLGATFRVGFPARVEQPAVLTPNDRDGRYGAGAIGHGGDSAIAVDAPLASIAPDHAEEPEPELAGMKVLIVEDDATAAEIASDALSDAGAEVRVAFDVDMALRFLADWRPDAILSDIGMPGRDGCALIAAVRMQETEEDGRLSGGQQARFRHRSEQASQQLIDQLKEQAREFADRNIGRHALDESAGIAIPAVDIVDADDAVDASVTASECVSEHSGQVPRIYAAAVTAYAGDDDRARALRAGFDAYLVKPVAPSQLIELLLPLASLHR